jgi:glycosyltransferase involved in cell wall biosynthesis
MKLDSTKSPLMILVPALNEEGAIAGVIREIHDQLPDTPILVVDDCSIDGTRPVAEQTGAVVISVPAHLGLGGCVQAGYKLAFESGFSYVIRVDGDGQHNPADIPRLYDTLVTSGVEMVIETTATPAGHADWVSRSFACSCGLSSDNRFVILLPVSSASTSERSQYLPAASRSNIRKLRRWSCCSASVSGSWRCLARCGRGGRAAPASRR